MGTKYIYIYIDTYAYANYNSISKMLYMVQTMCNICYYDCGYIPGLNKDDGEKKEHMIIEEHC